MNNRPNIAIITIDSLRWDVAEAANTPRIDKLFGPTTWKKVYAQGTYTLPSHIAIFQNGQLPTNEIDDNVPNQYTRRNNWWRWFQIELPWKYKIRECWMRLPESNSLVTAFEEEGYQTIGIGGVNWFSTEVITTDLWFGYFNTFIWRKGFQEQDLNSFVNQIDCIYKLKKPLDPPLFFFLNIASTHRPCRGDISIKGQIEALEHVDAHIMEVIDALPKPLTLFLLSDHGTLFEEDNAGIVGHGFYHPKVMEIPMNVVEVK